MPWKILPVGIMKPYSKQKAEGTGQTAFMFITGRWSFQPLKKVLTLMAKALVANLQLPPTRLRSDSTFRRVLVGIDFSDASEGV